MIKHSKSLLRKAEVYIKSLTKPRPEFNNLPICPALAQYRHEIQIIRARDNLEDQINQAC